MRGVMDDLGAMRLMMLALVLLCLPLAFFAHAEPVGWGVVGAYVAPALSVLLVFVLLLDALMSRVFAIDLPDTARGAARTRVRVDLLAVLAILLVWGPFYYSLLTL